MELEGKGDLEQSLARFDAWWRCEVLDRPPVNLSVAAGKSLAWPQKVHGSQRDRWLDMEHRIAAQEVWVQSRLWTADSMPTLRGDLGPELLATLYGAELEFTADTSFIRPMLSHSRDVLSLRANFENPYWNWMREFTRRSIERGRGRWITALPDFHTHADLLSAMREPQKLLLDLVEDYEGVKLAIAHLARLWDGVYDELSGAIMSEGLPTTSWLLAPYRGRSCVLQADFIAMVAPEMFGDVFLPGLEYESSRLDRSIFHLHGENALQHLDAILELPRLNAVQWMYGPGQGPAAKWIDVYRRIQSAGKGVHLLCETIEDALAVAEHLQPPGCYFEIAGECSEEEVSTFLKRLQKWSGGGGL